MGKTYNARKRKVKKNVPHGEVHIHTTFNNTVITITDAEGNTISWASPVAEANIIQDPEAAYILFKSGLKIKMAGLDATWDGYIAFDELEEFGKANWLSEKIYSMCGIYAEHYRERMKNYNHAIESSP